MKRILVLMLTLSLVLGMAGVAAAFSFRSGAEAEKSYAALSLKAAAEAAAAGETIDWTQYDWKPEYMTSNTGKWVEMLLADAAQRSFSQSGNHGTQPCLQVKQKEGKSSEAFKVDLIANQWASASWWSQSAVTYTAREAGRYVLSCDTMEPGRLWDSSTEGFVDTLSGANGDGHVTVYKNDEQIWPATGYASVTSENHPTFEGLEVELAVGDVIRFAGFGGEIGHADATSNPNSYLNNIFLNPAIEKKTEEPTTTTTTNTSPVPTRPDENPSDGALKPGIYSARDSLMRSLKNGDVLASELWHPVVSDKARPGWGLMQTNQETFSFKATDWAIPYVAPLAGGGVLLNANQWASAGWWDKSGIRFTAPADQSVILRGGELRTISAGSENALKKTEGRVAIYLNDRKIWPEDADYAVVKQGESVDFPELALDLKKGDVIVIEGYGAMPGEDITGDTGGEWQNQILLDPVVEVPESSGTTTTTAPAEGTTTTETQPVRETEYRASEVLLGYLRDGKLPADALWKPLYLDANCENGWKRMLLNGETFSMKATDWAMPYVYPIPDGGVLLNANQWANGGAYWDKAGIAYTAPEAQKVILRGGAIRTISAGNENALQKTEGRVAIYLNDRKIWPKDADYAAVKQGESVDFPELALDLKKGDIILIEGYGAMPGEDITGDTGGEWQNQILLDPVICVQRGDGVPEAGSSAAPALTAAFACAAAGAAVTVLRRRRSR